MSRKDKKRKKFFYRLFIILFILIIIYCSIKIGKWCADNKENKNVQNEISKMITIKEKKESINNEGEKENKELQQNEYEVDFKALKEKNPDTVAWLKVNGTNIEYVVVKTKDNKYYLKHNFNKEYNVGGWIFADYKNKIDGSDKNIVIYGHNMRDNSMFGSLKDVIKKKWYNNEENYEITFVTENETSIYKVFSVYQIEDEDYYIQTNFKNNSDFKNFINTLKKRSIKKFNIDVTENDSILTLSTCANNNLYRVVLHAKKIKNK